MQYTKCKNRDDLMLAVRRRIAKGELGNGIQVSDRLAMRCTRLVLAAMLDTLVDASNSEGMRLCLSNFGTFKLVDRPETRFCDPQNPGETILAPPARSVRFRPSQAMRERVAATLTNR